jgi:Cof subfamily protein (haloacid dehalogenase superfamily)
MEIVLPYLRSALMNTDRFVPGEPKKTVSLLVSDVDGTLLTPDKILTERARNVVLKLYDAGIKFAITSSRPPRGMSQLIEPLKISSPIAAFNGGVYVNPDLTLIREKVLSLALAEKVIAIIQRYKLDVWVYTANNWYVKDQNGPHVEHEQNVERFAATVVSEFPKLLDGAAKIVGVSDNHDAVAQCEAEMQKQLGAEVSATRSQAHYLDVTHPEANKGAVIDQLSQHFSIDRKSIATIGDGLNDVLMFRRSGMSIAMGNATAQVQAEATYVTESNKEEGFAKAVEKHVLGALVARS